MKGQKFQKRGTWADEQRPPPINRELKYTLNRLRLKQNLSFEAVEPVFVRGSSETIAPTQQRE
jgi:hypothetical protein